MLAAVDRDGAAGRVEDRADRDLARLGERDEALSLGRLSKANGPPAAEARLRVAPGGSLTYTVPLTGVTFSALNRTPAAAAVSSCCVPSTPWLAVLVVEVEPVEVGDGFGGDALDEELAAVTRTVACPQFDVVPALFASPE